MTICDKFLRPHFYPVERTFDCGVFNKGSTPPCELRQHSSVSHLQGFESEADVPVLSQIDVREDELHRAVLEHVREKLKRTHTPSRLNATDTNNEMTLPS